MYRSLLGPRLSHLAAEMTAAEQSVGVQVDAGTEQEWSADLKNYVERTDIANIISTMLEHVLKVRPDNPKEAMLEYMERCFPDDEDTLSANPLGEVSPEPRSPEASSTRSMSRAAAVATAVSFEPSVDDVRVVMTNRGTKRGNMVKTPRCDVGRWVHPATTSFCCIEESMDSAVLSTPGGDAGEFILALNVYTKLGGPLVDKRSAFSLVKEYLYNRMPEGRCLSMHTDIESLGRVAKAARVPLYDTAVTRPEGETERVHLREVITLPENQGCQHLRFMMENPGEYDTPREIVEWFVRCFYEVLWSQDEKNKKAVLTVTDKRSDDVECVASYSVHPPQYPLAPAIYAYPPKQAGEARQLIYHPQAIRSLRESLASFVAEKLGHASMDLVKLRMNQLASRQFLATLERLAPGAPVFNVTYELGESTALPPK